MNRLMEQFKYKYIRDGVGVEMENLWMDTGIYYSSVSYASRRYSLCTGRYNYPHFANTAVEIQNFNIIRYPVMVRAEI